MLIALAAEGICHLAAAASMMPFTEFVKAMWSLSSSTTRPPVLDQQVRGHVQWAGAELRVALSLADSPACIHPTSGRASSYWLYCVGINELS
jgi:hypothetical protein